MTTKPGWPTPKCQTFGSPRPVVNQLSLCADSAYRCWNEWIDATVASANPPLADLLGRLSARLESADADDEDLALLREIDKVLRDRLVADGTSFAIALANLYRSTHEVDVFFSGYLHGLGDT